LKSHVYTDASRNRPMVIDGLFYGLNGRHTPGVAYIVPRINPIRVIEGAGATTRHIRSLIRKLRLKHCSSLGLARRFLPLMIRVGPPPPIAAPAICVTRNEVLL